MRTLKKRLYLPLPPEDLSELSKDLRMLFHADVQLPKVGKWLNEPHLDNPGVRPDSRRRFAAGKWIHVAKELGQLLPDWKKENQGFATELVRSWIDQPEQILLLHYALRIGIKPRDAKAIRAKIHELESDRNAYGYFTYLAAFFLEQASRRGLSAPLFRHLPLGKWAKDGIRNRRRHPVLLNKSRQYLITQTKLTEAESRAFLRGAQDNFCTLLRCARDGVVSCPDTHHADLASQLAAHGFVEETRHDLLEKILRKSDAPSAGRFLRQVMVAHVSKGELDGIIRVAKKSGCTVPELAVFRIPRNTNKPAANEHLYRAILRGIFRAPLEWCEFAKRIADLLKDSGAERLGARGLIHPFSILRAPDGSLKLAQNASPNLAFAGYAARFGSLIGFDSSRAWCLPIGLLLHAAATTDPRSLLGFSSPQRFRTLSAMQPLLAEGGALPDAAGEILKRLFAWPGSRISPFASIAEFGDAIESLYNHLKEQSAGKVTVCDVAGSDWSEC